MLKNVIQQVSYAVNVPIHTSDLRHDVEQARKTFKKLNPDITTYGKSKPISHKEVEETIDTEFIDAIVFLPNNPENETLIVPLAYLEPNSIDFEEKNRISNQSLPFSNHRPNQFIAKASYFDEYLEADKCLIKLPFLQLNPQNLSLTDFIEKYGLNNLIAMQSTQLISKNGNLTKNLVEFDEIGNEAALLEQYQPIFNDNDFYYRFPYYPNHGKNGFLSFKLENNVLLIKISRH